MVRLLPLPTPQGVAKRLVESRKELARSAIIGESCPIPSALEVRDIIEDLRELLFPGLTDGRGPAKGSDLSRVTAQVEHLAVRLQRQISLARQCVREPHTLGEPSSISDRITERTAWAFIDELPKVRAALLEDAVAAMAGDPAASSAAEVVLSYPGHYATTVQRLAHVLWQLRVPLLPRMMTEHAHRLTGVDIHPGAVIGPSFFIDHGTGVVIGETTLIGAGVRLYQGVTLGALAFPADQVAELRAGPKRHPTLEDDVVVYAGATILGGDTVIGQGSIIGGNAWVVESVLPRSRVFVKTNTRIKPESAPRPTLRGRRSDLAARRPSKRPHERSADE